MDLNVLVIIWKKQNNFGNFDNSLEQLSMITSPDGRRQFTTISILFSSVLLKEAKRHLVGRFKYPLLPTWRTFCF